MARLPAGTYWGRPIEAGYDTFETRDGDIREYVWVKCLVTAIQKAQDVWEEVAPNTVRELRLLLTPNCLEYTQKKLIALGWNKDASDLTFSGEPAEKGVKLVCKHDQRGDKAYENWDVANWGGSGGTNHETLTGQQQARCRALLGKGLKKDPKPRGSLEAPKLPANDQPAEEAPQEPAEAPSAHEPASPADDPGFDDNGDPAASEAGEPDVQNAPGPATKKEAWDALCEINQRAETPLDPSELQAKWYALMQQVVPTLSENQFTGEHWRMIVDKIWEDDDIPF